MEDTYEHLEETKVIQAANRLESARGTGRSRKKTIVLTFFF